MNAEILKPNCKQLLDAESCWQVLYAALLPAFKVFPVPATIALIKVIYTVKLIVTIGCRQSVSNGCSIINCIQSVSCTCNHCIKATMGAGLFAAQPNARIVCSIIPCVLSVSSS